MNNKYNLILAGLLACFCFVNCLDNESSSESELNIQNYTDTNVRLEVNKQGYNPGQQVLIAVRIS